MARYAKGTISTVDKSKGEIERTLVRFGAEQYVSGQSKVMEFIMFVYHGRTIRIAFDKPAEEDFSTTNTGRRRRSKKSKTEALERARREQWRALLLMVKAKLVGCEQGLTTVEDEFLAYTVLPNGKTMTEWINPQIEAMIETNKMPQNLITGLIEGE